MKAGRIGSAELADLVARGATVDRDYAVAELPRLAALAPPDEDAGAARLAAGLTFRTGAEGHPQLHLQVTGPLPLACQRCLGRLEWPVAIDVVLTMVGTDEEAATLAEPFDSVLLAEGALDVAAVIEDEVLAALPLAPRHAAAACGVDAGSAEGLSTGELHRPMAGLADLLGRGGRQGDK